MPRFALIAAALTVVTACSPVRTAGNVAVGTGQVALGVAGLAF